MYRAHPAPFDAMVANLNVGCRVEGNYGPFVPNVCNPDGSQVKRRRRERLQGPTACSGPDPPERMSYALRYNPVFFLGDRNFSPAGVTFFVT